MRYKIIWFNPKLQDWDEISERFKSEGDAVKFLERNPHIRKNDAQIIDTNDYGITLLF